MEYQSVKLILCFWSIALLMFLGVSVPYSWCGPVRITMEDGSSVEAPYYWEEGDQIKFDMGSGVVGIPRSQIASIREIIVTQEFDPDVLLQNSINTPDSGKGNVLEDEIATKIIPRMESYEALNPEEFNKLLAALQTAEKERTKGQEEKTPRPILSPMLEQRDPFARLGRIRGEGDMLVLVNPIISQGDLEDQRFTLTLYDADGNVLRTKPCEVYKVDIDQVTLKRLNIKGKVFTLVNVVEPDPQIARYEITAND